METLTFKVKDKSLEEFFTKYMQVDRNDRDRGCMPGYYNMFKDEIFVKISSGLISGQSVIIEIENDNGMGRPIKNVYKYSIQEYDSITHKLILEDFQVEAVKK